MSQEIEKPKLILIADKEGLTLPVQRIKDLLEKEEYLVHIETDGFEALMWLESNLPDLVLIDLSLPRLNGFDLMKTLRYLSRSYHEYRKIIFATTYTAKDSKSLAQAINAGARFLIPKPWQITDLLNKIKKALAGSKM